MRPHPAVHPLTLFFHSRKFTAAEGMNRLQDRGLVSDNAIMPEDVAACDVDRVLRLFHSPHFIPAARRTTEDLAAMGVK